jgi:pimeloyl-ACP methyl ester carboxylesterase
MVRVLPVRYRQVNRDTGGPMHDPQFLVTKTGRHIAYHQSAGQGPGVVFLGGLRSDMTGSKALYLQNWAQSQGRAFLRFDYSGHGQSSGRFQDGAIGDWFADAEDALSLTSGPQILVGSSMGGWVALLLARANPARIAGLVSIAAAPDFTEDIWAALDETQQKQLQDTGKIALKSDYSEDPTIITKRMIDDGRNHLILKTPLHLPFPTRFLQGTDDPDVPPSVAITLLNHARGPDIQLTLVKGADHRFSTPDCLAMITAAVADVTGRASR